MRSGVLPVGNRDQSFHDRTSTKPAIFCKTVFTSVFYIPYVTYVNSIRNAKDFFIKTLSDGPLRFKYYDHALCEENNQFETFSKCVSKFLAGFFSTWKLSPESNSSPRERSNHTKIIKIHREKPSQTLISLAKLINWDR